MDRKWTPLVMAAGFGLVEVLLWDGSITQRIVTAVAFGLMAAFIWFVGNAIADAVLRRRGEL